MEKLKFKEKEFEEVKNENFSRALSRFFIKSVNDKKRSRLLFFGGCEISNWERSFPLFSVYNPKLSQSLKKLYDFFYIRGYTKFNQKYWKNDFIAKELINKESAGNCAFCRLIQECQKSTVWEYSFSKSVWNKFQTRGDLPPFLLNPSYSILDDFVFFYGGFDIKEVFSRA